MVTTQNGIPLKNQGTYHQGKAKVRANKRIWVKILSSYRCDPSKFTLCYVLRVLIDQHCYLEFVKQKSQFTLNLYL